MRLQFQAYVLAIIYMYQRKYRTITGDRYAIKTSDENLIHAIFQRTGETCREISFSDLFVEAEGEPYTILLCLPSNDINFDASVVCVFRPKSKHFKSNRNPFLVYIMNVRLCSSERIGMKILLFLETFWDNPEITLRKMFFSPGISLYIGITLRVWLYILIFY